jgi:putative endonuclease
MQPTVYILASRPYGVLYVGVTRQPVQRIWRHRAGQDAAAFTKRYHVHSLVYFELHARMIDAIRREKQIMEWKRAWKIALVESVNPEWRDLWPALTPGHEGRSRPSPG